MNKQWSALQKISSGSRSRFMSVLSAETVLGVAVRIVLTIPVWVVPLMGATKSTVFTSGFESGFTGWKKELCCKDSATIVSSPKRAGEHAVKFTLRKDDPKRRSELRQGSVPANSEHWYGFSNLVPANYAKDRSYEIVAQWHEMPDRDLGEPWRRPPLTLSIRNDRFGVSNRWDPKPLSVKFKEAGSQSWDLGTVPKGDWTDWVFHVKWSHKSDGLVEVWKNGQLVVRKTGPNTYNDKKGPYFKIGIYKPDWKADPEKSTTTQRVIYYDQIQVRS